MRSWASGNSSTRCNSARTSLRSPIGKFARYWSTNWQIAAPPSSVALGVAPSRTRRATARSVVDSDGDSTTRESPWLSPSGSVRPNVCSPTTSATARPTEPSADNCKNRRLFMCPYCLPQLAHATLGGKLLAPIDRLNHCLSERLSVLSCRRWGTGKPSRDTVRG